MKIIKDYLTPNRWSRPQRKMKKVKGLVIHWVANPNSTAKQNRDFFENRKYGKTDFGSAHEIIDLNGDVVLCVPSNEITYNCGSKTYRQSAIQKLGDYPNGTTYAIECTHLDWYGNMTKETSDSLFERCVDLCIEFGLNPLEDIWLHKEVVGWKNCHLYFVNNPKKWINFKKKVNNKIESLKVPKWKKDSMRFLKDNGFVKGNHDVDDNIDLITFAHIYNNYEMQDPMQYLVDRGFLKRKPRSKYQKLSWGMFSKMIANKNKAIFSRNPIKYLFKLGFITSNKNSRELLTFAYLGAMFRNYFRKNRKL